MALDYSQQADITRALKDSIHRRGLLDYPYFVRSVLGLDCLYSRDPGTEDFLNTVGTEILQWLEGRDKQKVPRKLLLTVPRKTFKTSGVSEVAPVFASCHDPNLSCGVMSWSYEKLAIPIAESIRDNFAGKGAKNRISQIYGDFHGEGSREHWSGNYFNIDQRTVAKRDPTVSTFGVRQGAVGHHFDLFILDDPVSNEAMSNDSSWLDRVWRCWIDMKATLNPNSLVIVVMTRYHDGDLAGRIIEREIKPQVKREFDGKLPDDWDNDSFAAIEKYAPLAGWKAILKQSVSGFDTETPTYNFPTIWSEERIADVRAGKSNEEDDESDEYSELFFWCQLQNQPHKRGDNPIKELHVKSALGSPENWSLDEAPRVGYVDIFCDFAFKDAEAYAAQRGDFTVAHVTVPRDGFVWRVNGYRGKPTQEIFGQELIKLAHWAKNDFNSRIRYLTFDKTTGQGSGDDSMKIWIEGLFRRHPSLNTPTVVAVPRTRKKEALILSTVWAWQESWIRLCREAPGNDPLVYQAMRIGQTAHDDDIDAFSTAFLPEYYMSAARLEGNGPTSWEWSSAVDFMEDDFADEVSHVGF